MKKPEVKTCEDRRMTKSWNKVCLATALLLAATSASAMWAANADDRADQKNLRPQTLDMSRAGSEVTRRLFVTEDRSYTFAMRLKLRDESEGAREENRDGDKLASEQFRRLLRETRPAREGSPFKAGLVIPLRLKISVAEAAGERVVVDKELDQQRLESVQSDTIWVRIGKIDLPPGFYRLSIQSRSGSAELSRVPASVEISWVRKVGSASRGSDDMSALLAKIQSTDLLAHLSSLEQIPLGATGKFFLRAETFAMPDAFGVLDACSHRLHLNHESGNFWVVRRCEGSGVAIFRSAPQGQIVAPALAQTQTQALAFKRH